MAGFWGFSHWFTRPPKTGAANAPSSSLPIDPAQVSLAEIEDTDFLWLLAGGRMANRQGFSLAPGRLETPRTLTALRLLNAKVRDALNPGAWLILVDQQVCGLCSYKAAPREAREIEIGYGISSSRRGRGIARAAIGQMIERSRQDTRIHALTAQTEATNAASQRVLARHGFIVAGHARQPDGSTLRVWRLALR